MLSMVGWFTLKIMIAVVACFKVVRTVCSSIVMKIEIRHMLGSLHHMFSYHISAYFPTLTFQHMLITTIFLDIAKLPLMMILMYVSAPFHFT